MRKVHVTPMFSFGSWSGFTWHIIKTTNMFIGLVYIFPHGFSFLVRRWAHATRLSKSQKRWPARATRLASFASRLFGVVTMYILHNLSPGEIPKFCFFSETQELSIISPKLHGNERKRGGNNGCWDMGIAYREKKLFLLELCADRNQIMFIFAVTNNRFGMPWQKKKKVFTEALLLFLHFTRTLPHKLTEDKLGSGTCEQMISSRTLKAVLATSRRGFHTMRFISEKTEHAWENISASVSAYRLRIWYRCTGHATWRGG